MRFFAIIWVIVISTSVAFAEDGAQDSLIRVEVNLFMEALKTGQGDVAASMFSSSAYETVDLMLGSLKRSYNDNPEVTLRRLSGSGYTIAAEEIEDWEKEAYLAATLSLPMISARYLPYEISIDTVQLDNREALVQMVFTTATGVEIPQEATLSFEEDYWRISSFMGITAFP